MTEQNLRQLGSLRHLRASSVASRLQIHVDVVSVVVEVHPYPIVLWYSPVGTTPNPNTKGRNFDHRPSPSLLLFLSVPTTEKARRKHSRRRRRSRAGHRGGLCAHFVVNRFKLDSAGIRLLDSEKKSGMLACRTLSIPVQRPSSAIIVGVNEIGRPIRVAM